MLPGSLTGAQIPFDRRNFVQKQLLFEDTVKSEEETRSMLARFGIGTASQKEPKDMDMEELQEYAMNDIKQ